MRRARRQYIWSTFEVDQEFFPKYFAARHFDTSVEIITSMLRSQTKCATE